MSNIFQLLSVKCNDVETKQIMICGQLVEVKCYPEMGKRKVADCKIRGKSIHDAKLVEHLSEDQVLALESKKKKSGGVLGGLLG